jgi:hypothetical protein
MKLNNENGIQKSWSDSKESTDLSNVKGSVTGSYLAINFSKGKYFGFM